MTEPTILIPPPKPGLYFDVPVEEYLRWDAANASTLTKMRIAPAIAKYSLDHMDDDDDKEPDWAVFGHLFHLLVTEGKKAAGKEFAIKPETYPAKWNGNAKYCKAWVKENPGKKKPKTYPAAWNGNADYCKDWIKKQQAAGKRVVSSDGTASKPGAQQAIDMAKVVRDHPQVGELVRKAKIEVSVVWVDPQTGVTCKGRFDLWVEGANIAGDLKSTAGLAKADPFWREADKRDYGLQVAMYLDAIKALQAALILPMPPDDMPNRFMLIAVEKRAPHLLNGFDIFDDMDDESYDWLDLARRDYVPLLGEYKRCKESGEWPGYGADTKPMMLTAYRMKILNDLRKLSMSG